MERNWSKNNSLKSSFKSREHIQKKKQEPYLAVSASQASSVTLAISGDEGQRKAYCNFLDLIRRSSELFVSIKKSPYD